VPPSMELVERSYAILCVEKILGKCAHPPWLGFEAHDQNWRQISLDCRTRSSSGLPDSSPEVDRSEVMDDVLSKELT
jgi:hypothetical protein